MRDTQWLLRVSSWARCGSRTRSWLRQRCRLNGWESCSELERGQARVPVLLLCAAAIVYERHSIARNYTNSREVEPEMQLTYALARRIKFQPDYMLAELMLGWWVSNESTNHSKQLKQGPQRYSGTGGACREGVATVTDLWKMTLRSSDVVKLSLEGLHYRGSLAIVASAMLICAVCTLHHAFLRSLGK
jgi:hypothetical protein